MRLIFWVTALAVLSIAWAKNSTAKTKPKRQLDNIRSPQNLQYSLVLPHSRVTHFRSLNSNRRISHGPKGKLPPYAVQMEPVVQYSQKDPLYDPTQENLDDSVVNQNQIYAQSKILNVQDSHENFGPPYGSLPTAPLYSHEPQPQYYDAPEPIIEIIIKESNETLPAPPPQPIQKKKKEPVHVFYVKYSKDPHSHDKVIYDKPIPAITPSTNEEEEHHHHDEYVTVTPEPYIHRETTTLRAIIKPESEIYHSDSSVKITFGNEGRHYSDRREGTQGEDREETAPRPAIALPNQGPPQPHLAVERAASPRPQYNYETESKSTVYHPSAQQYRQSSHNSQHAQSRIQFQPQAFPTEQQLPRQNPTAVPFRSQSIVRHPFGSSPSLIPNPAFSNGPPGIITHFGGPTVPTPVGPSFQPAFSRTNERPSFNSRPSISPSFSSRPQFNGPPRASFHSGPQRPFHQPQPQSKPYFDEAKYLQENYHTITTEQVDPPKEQVVPSRQPQTFNRIPQVGPSPTPTQFQDHFNRHQVIAHNQQLPQQRPLQSLNPSSSPFFNLKPSPPHIETNRPFQQSSQFDFHQGQTLPGPAPSPAQHAQHSFSNPINASPSSIPKTQFLPQPSSPSLYNFQPQPSPTPELHFHRHNSPSERPQFQHSQGPSERPPIYQTHGPSERPAFSQQSHFKEQNLQHQQNVGQLVPNGGELIPAIPKYEQHITVNGPTAQTNYNLLGESSQPSLTPSHNEQQYRQQQLQRQQEQQYHHLQHEQQQQQKQREEQQQKQREQQQQKDQQHQQRDQQHQQQLNQEHVQQQQLQQKQREHQQQQQQQQQREHQHQQQQREHQQQQLQREHQQQQQQQQQQQIVHQQQQQQQQQYDAEQEQVRQQLAQNVQKQQEEIQRLQAQLYLSQQQQEPHIRQYNQQAEVTSPRSQYIQERSRYQSSSASPPYYQSTSRTVEIKPSTQKYVSSTANSISPTSEPKKEDKKKKPTFELPDEVPDDLRQQLLSSGILDNADISVLDYDKVGETPLESLPPDQLANFFSAGGGQQIAASENRPIYVKPDEDQIESRNIDDMDEDQEIAASENIPSYVAPPSEKQAVEMKVVHFNPNTEEGKKIANNYVQENATQVDPVALNDKKYNRYLPLKVSGNQFPLPDILKGRKVTSVVVLAPVETEAINSEHSRKERATSNSLKGIKFVAGDSLQDLLKKPTKDNFEKWLTVEKKTAADLQSIILLVTGNESPEEDREIFMYDIASGNVNKLSGELSNAFVEAAENNSLSKNIESLAIEGDGIPENFQKDDVLPEGSENVPLFVDLSGVSLDNDNGNNISISSSYSKTKLGRSLRRNH